MKIKGLGLKNILYLLPYLLILLLGVWYRLHTSSLAMWDGDSYLYLRPVCLKQLIGEWHKGERPMQYLMFIYYTLLGTYKLKNLITVQKILGMIGATFFTGAWLFFIRRFKDNTLLWHLAGYFIIYIYISSPQVMYYETQIGPESFSISLMSMFLFFLSGFFASTLKPLSRSVLLGAAMFMNLYLINPMPKCIFANIFTDLILIWLVINFAELKKRAKVYLILIPHLLYVLLVAIPEYTHTVNAPNEDRVFIEYEQMAFTHFDLLSQDKTNFNITPQVQDSIIRFFNESKINSPYLLIGFNSDYLMWSSVNYMIRDHYHANYDSIGAFYKHLNYVLVTKYPWQLSREICKQTIAFYLPNKTIHKELFNVDDIRDRFELTIKLAKDAEPGFYNDNYLWQKEHHQFISQDLFSAQYPASLSDDESINFSQLPFQFNTNFAFYYYFDYIFLLAMILFFVVRIIEGKFFSWDLITLLYAYIAVYVITISIVHTFDIGRFVITIYPFLLLVTFFALTYIVDVVLNVISNRININSALNTKIAVFISLMLFAYLLWELYWCFEKGYASIKWHTHLMPFVYLGLFGFLLYRYWSRRHTSKFSKNVFRIYISVISLLFIIEAFLVISGSNKTISERTIDYYETPYKVIDSNWYHTYTPGKLHWIEQPEYYRRQAVNSLGFADIEWNKNKSAQEKRILVFGNSFTEDGSPQYDSSFTLLLRDRLQAQGDSLCLMNGGISGSDPFDNFIIFRDRLLVFKPDVVIQLLGSSDINSKILIRGGMERFQKDGTVKYYNAPWWEPIYAMSYTSRSFISIAGYNESLQKKVMPPDDRERVDINTLDLLTQYAALCKKNEMQLVVVLYPEKKEMQANKYNCDFSFLSRMPATEVKVIDLLPLYSVYMGKNHSTITDYYWKSSEYHNTKGYKMMTDILSMHISSMVEDTIQAQR
jgi:hypothetical protein